MKTRAITEGVNNRWLCLSPIFSCYWDGKFVIKEDKILRLSEEANKFSMFSMGVKEVFWEDIFLKGGEGVLQAKSMFISPLLLLLMVWKKKHLKGIRGEFNKRLLYLSLQFSFLFREWEKRVWKGNYSQGKKGGRHLRNIINTKKTLFLSSCLTPRSPCILILL